MKFFTVALLAVSAAAIRITEKEGGDGKPKKPSCFDKVFDDVWMMTDQDGDGKLQLNEFHDAADFVDLSDDEREELQKIAFGEGEKMRADVPREEVKEWLRGELEAQGISPKDVCDFAKDLDKAWPEYEEAGKELDCFDKVFDDVWGMVDEDGDNKMCEGEFHRALDAADVSKKDREELGKLAFGEEEKKRAHVPRDEVKEWARAELEAEGVSPREICEFGEWLDNQGDAELKEMDLGEGKEKAEKRAKKVEKKQKQVKKDLKDVATEATK